jgi:hypothetical protein
MPVLTPLLARHCEIIFIQLYSRGEFLSYDLPGHAVSFTKKYIEVNFNCCFHCGRNAKMNGNLSKSYSKLMS